MIDSNLSLRTVGDRVGSPVQKKSKTFDEDDFFVLWLKRMRELERAYGYDYVNNRILREGILGIQGAWGIGGVDQFGERLQSEGYSVDFVNNPLYVARFMSVAEAAINAIEHGTAYCEKGLVRLDFIKGSKGLLIIVNQPGKGFKLEMPSSRKSGEKILRGNGLSYLCEHDIVRVGSERKGRGFNLLLYYDRDRT